MQVEVVCPSLTNPVLFTASLKQYAQDICRLESSSMLPDAVKVGASVVVGMHDGTQILGEIQAIIASSDVLIAVRRVTQSEQRYLPRSEAEVDLSYVVLRERSELEAAEAWFQGRETDSGLCAWSSRWHRIRNEMDFSGVGVKFEDSSSSLCPGDRLAIALILPETKERHRAIARVVRVEEQKELRTALVAIEFVQISPETVYLLSEYSLDQEISEYAEVTYA